VSEYERPPLRVLEGGRTRYEPRPEMRHAVTTVLWLAVIGATTVITLLVLALLTIARAIS
jgi:hypothetical protein